MEIVRLTGTPNNRDGEWIRVRQYGFYVADLRSVAELECYVALAELEDALRTGLARPHVQTVVLEPGSLPCFQLQTYEPEDPPPGDGLLVGDVQAVPAQYHRWSPLPVRVQDLGVGSSRIHERTRRELTAPGQHGAVCAKSARPRVAHGSRLEHACETGAEPRRGTGR